MVATPVLSARRGPLVLGTAVAATVLVVATIVLTVTQVEPLNRLADSWNPDALPADRGTVRDTWTGLHLVRTVLAVAAFALLLASQVADVGVLTGRSRTPASVAA